MGFPFLLSAGSLSWGPHSHCQPEDYFKVKGIVSGDESKCQLQNRWRWVFINFLTRFANEKDRFWENGNIFIRLACGEEAHVLPGISYWVWDYTCVRFSPMRASRLCGSHYANWIGLNSVLEIEIRGLKMKRLEGYSELNPFSPVTFSLELVLFLIHRCCCWECNFSCLSSCIMRGTEKQWEMLLRFPLPSS